MPTLPPTACPSISSLAPRYSGPTLSALLNVAQSLREDILGITPSLGTTCSTGAHVSYYRPSRLHLTDDSQTLTLLLLPQFEVETSGNEFNKVVDRQLVPGNSQGCSRESFHGGSRKPIGLMNCCSQRESSQLSGQGKGYCPPALTRRVSICPKRKGWTDGGHCTRNCPALPAEPPTCCVLLSKT